MVICLVVGLLIPSVCAWVVAIGDLRVIDPPLHNAEAAFTALSVLLIPLSILVSSSGAAGVLGWSLTELGKLKPALAFVR
jgi:hypothetical protein